MPYFQTNDQVSLYFEKEGKGEALVFIHPPGMGSVTFFYQRELSEYFQVITPDLRGNGQSKPGKKKITISLLSKDINELTEHLGIEKIVLCGYSSGGSIAQELAIVYPEKVKGIILIGGFPEVSTRLLEAEFMAGIALTGIGGLPILSKMISIGHGNSIELKKKLEDYMNKTDPYSLFQLYKAGFLYHCTKSLNKIKAPLLLVYGNRDPFCQAYEILYKKYVKNVKTVFINKANHQIPTKFSQELNAIIKEFMKELSMKEVK
ncbi:alpha/beta fold hydrolase [Metabacillus arenae]|uniref:Alpha/beta hydrolase n=1 Tax=Metabacillus arenae TaxID=2771434 RepID=A0A926NNS0_9BACI|nr:alpha/beta hydrolase [Metabacillus arenae]MBD1381327.1 alpha/beta hydrolase [Metabacillus arenae]